LRPGLDQEAEAGRGQREIEQPPTMLLPSAGVSGRR
jgi:hypothetical protein